MKRKRKPKHSEPTNNKLFTIEQACEYSGIGRSFLYQRIGAKQIKAVKAGKRIFVVRESLDKWIDNLPEANIKDYSK
jgi:excisionase family DNA binding protein